MHKPVVEQLKNKKVLVVGLGVQGGGLGLVKFLSKIGAKVTATDLRLKAELQESLEQLHGDINLTLGKHEDDDFLGADIIFKGPSVPWDLPQLKTAQEKGIPIEMEASFFVQNCPAEIIGVTGTRGKTTVATLIYEILKDQLKDRKVFLGGNIPDRSTIELLEEVTEKDIVVLELSSWALSGFHQKKLSPHIAVFTNLYPDHLNYYEKLDDYLYDKKAIYLYQKNNDILIANKNLESEISKDNPQGKIVYFEGKDFRGQLRYLKGSHNQENAEAVIKIIEALGLDVEKARSLIENFQGVSFRQQKIRELGDVSFINDTTSTTPVATEKAIETFSDRPIVLILGGNSKNLPSQDLLKSLEKVDKIVLLKGSFTDEIRGQLNEKYASKITGEYDELNEAVSRAYEEAQKIGKSYVLFSPGATSFSMFKNEFDRGRTFNEIVQNLK